MGQLLVLYITCDDVKGTVCVIQSDLTVQKALTDSQEYPIKLCLISEVKTLEWWILRSMLNPLLFLKGVCAKNERGYRLSTIKSAFDRY